jgi:hypothetical protein
MNSLLKLFPVIWILLSINNCKSIPVKPEIRNLRKIALISVQTDSKVIDANERVPMQWWRAGTEDVCLKLQNKATNILIKELEASLPSIEIISGNAVTNSIAYKTFENNFLNWPGNSLYREDVGKKILSNRIDITGTPKIPSAGDLVGFAPGIEKKKYFSNLAGDLGVDAVLAVEIYLRASRSGNELIPFINMAVFSTDRNNNDIIDLFYYQKSNIPAIKIEKTGFRFSKLDDADDIVDLDDLYNAYEIGIINLIKLLKSDINNAYKAE